MSAAPGLYRSDAAGISLLYRSGSGGGVPYVMLHGVGSDAQSWVPLMNALDPAFDVFAWDAPGYAGSVALPMDHPTPADYADALLRALDVLGLGRVVLVGHSLGALFAGRLAVRAPDRVAALGLLSPALGYRVVPGATLPPSVQTRIDDLHRLGAPAFAAARAARLVHRPETKPAVAAAVQRAMGAVHPGGYAQAVRALGAGDLLADAADIRSRTLVAVGAEDVVAPPANARALHARLSHALPLVEVAGSGHALPQEAPGRVAGLLGLLRAGSAHA